MLAVGAASGRGPATGARRDRRATRAGRWRSSWRARSPRSSAGAPVARGDRRGCASGSRGAEVGALAAALERSRTYGSPLAEQLHLQATALRRDARRRIEERAARAAPKIQLVVALVLVPSVLLMIVAAIVAHSDALLGQL